MNQDGRRDGISVASTALAMRRAVKTEVQHAFGNNTVGNGLRLSTLTRHCRQNMSALYQHDKTKCNTNTVCQLVCFISPI